MNVSIFIRLFIIFIENRLIEEKIREVVSPEIIFCKNYNLLIYSKSTIIIARKILLKATVKEIELLESNSFLDFEDDLSDVKEI